VPATNRAVGYGLDDRDSIPSGGNDGISCLHHRYVQTGSGDHPASCRVGSGEAVGSEICAFGSSNKRSDIRHCSEAPRTLSSWTQSRV